MDDIYIERGFKIPSFNYALEVEEVAGRVGGVLKDRKIGPLEFEIPLIVRNDTHTNRNGQKIMMIS